MGNLNISSLSLSLFPSFLPFQQAGIPPSPSFSYASSIHPGPSLTPPHPHPPTQPSPAPTHRYLLTTKMTLAWNMRSHLFSTETFSVFLEEAFFFFLPWLLCHLPLETAVLAPFFPPPPPPPPTSTKFSRVWLLLNQTKGGERERESRVGKGGEKREGGGGCLAGLDGLRRRRRGRVWKLGTWGSSSSSSSSSFSSSSSSPSPSVSYCRRRLLAPT